MIPITSRSQKFLIDCSDMSPTLSSVTAGTECEDGKAPERIQPRFVSCATSSSDNLMRLLVIRLQ